MVRRFPYCWSCFNVAQDYDTKVKHPCSHCGALVTRRTEYAHRKGMGSRQSRVADAYHTGGLDRTIAPLSALEPPSKRFRRAAGVLLQLPRAQPVKAAEPAGLPEQASGDDGMDIDIPGAEPDSDPDLDSDSRSDATASDLEAAHPADFLHPDVMAEIGTRCQSRVRALIITNNP